MKKIISVLLTLVMLFTLAVPAFAAGSGEKTVNIYLTGYGSSLYDENGEKIYGIDLDLVGGLKEILDKVIISLVKGELTGDYEEFCDQIYNLIAPAYADVRLDNNGEATDTDGNAYFGVGYDQTQRLNYYTDKKYDGGYYQFKYDWRLSCEYNAELLEKYVDFVMQSTGASKYNLIGRCLGGNIVSAYLQSASEERLAKLNKAIDTR